MSIADDDLSTILLDNVAAEDQDAFQYKKLARSVATSLQKAAPPFVAALCAPWGAGKSTFLRYYVESLPSASSGCLVVYFNAWRASVHGDILGAFVESLTSQLRKARAISVPQAFARDAARAVAALLPRFSNAAMDFLPLPGPMTKAAKSAVAPLIDLAASRIQREAEFRRAFAGLCEALSDRDGPTRATFVPYVLIDELDRCAPITVVQVLEAIRLYFCSDDGLEPCIANRYSEKQVLSTNPFRFILAFDEAYVVRSFCSVYDLSPIEAYSYVSKFIQHRYHFPEKTWHRFVKDVSGRSRHAREMKIENSARDFSGLLKCFRLESAREARRVFAYLELWHGRFCSRKEHSPPFRRVMDTFREGQDQESFVRLINAYLFFWALIKVTFPNEVYRIARLSLLPNVARGSVTHKNVGILLGTAEGPALPVTHAGESDRGLASPGLSSADDKQASELKAWAQWDSPKYKLADALSNAVQVLEGIHNSTFGAKAAGLKDGARDPFRRPLAKCMQMLFRA